MSETNSSSDWIYILLTLLTAGLSLIKSLSKKNKKTEFETVIPENDAEEFSRYDREDMIVDEYINIEKESDSKEIPEPGYDPEARKHNREIPASEEDESNTEDADFDLKKAVIYHEILNKKYE